MSESRFPLVGLVIGVLLGAGATWFALDGRTSALTERVDDAEEALERAERESGNWKASAAMEVERNGELQARVEELERLRKIASRAAPPNAGTGHGSPPDSATNPPATAKKTDPSVWSDQTYRANLDRLTANAGGARKTALYAAVLKKAESNGEAGRKYLASLLAIDLGKPDYKIVATMLLDDLGKPDVVPQILAAYEKLDGKSDLLLRNTLLNALAALPGDEALPHLLAALNEPEADRSLHRAALRGLGLRRHPMALAAARGQVQGVGKVLRYATIGNLNIAERESGYQSAEVRTAFEDALSNLDGDKQAEVILEALGKYWSKTSVEPLRAYGAGKFGSRRMRSRGENLAEQIASGAPRPSDKEGSPVPDGNGPK